MTRDPGGFDPSRVRPDTIFLETLIHDFDALRFLNPGAEPVDHPGTPFARAADTLALVEAVGNPYLRMNLDLYHAQIGEGNLIELVQRALPFVGEIQVADVPGRCEPGTGEINYKAVAAALHRLGYTGVVGLEAWASGDPLTALNRFRAAFIV